MKLLRPALVLSLALGASPSPAAQTSSAEIAAKRVALLREALGWERLAAEDGVVRVTGAATFLGTDARQEILFDSRGRFATRFEGPLCQSSGYDGKANWVVDWNGVARTQVLGDAAQADVQRLFLSGAWCLPDAPLAFHTGERVDTLAFRHVDGVLEGTLRLDADLRPSELEFGREPGRAHWHFEDWAEHDGLWFPGHLSIQQSGHVQDFTFESLERPASLPASSFEVPLEHRARARFDPQVPAELEVRRSPTGHLLVRGRVDGQDLGWFIFDTGAGTNCISTHVAQGHVEGPFGSISARGIGGTVPAGFWRAKTLQVGPLTLEDTALMGLDLGFLSQPFGVEVAGIIGFEFLAMCTVEFDARDSTIAVHDPARYTLPGAGRWEPVVLYGRHPCVQASFDGHAGTFKIDTGAAGDTVTMHYDAVRDLALLEGRESREARAGGVGGLVATRAGRFERFELGGHVFEGLEAAFAMEPVGAFADPYVLGNIGGKLLEPFVLVLDYPHLRLGFLPR